MRLYNKVYEAGAEAARKTRPDADDCPYPSGTFEKTVWMAGFYGEDFPVSDE